MISVIVPVHFGGIGLRQCVRSILDELAPGDEVIVVADGESDRAWQGLDALGARVIVNPSRRGPAFARNRGAEAARGDTLFFVDADCLLLPGSLELIRQTFREDPSLAAIVGSYDDAPAHPSFPSQYRNLLHHYTHQRSNYLIRTFWGACGAVRREAFIAVGGFNEDYDRPCIEDIELGLQLAEAGYRICLLKDVQVRHLKEWTARSIVRTDVLLRAAPWTELLLRHSTIEDNLNTSRRSRVSVAATLAGAGLASLAAALLAGGAPGAAGLAALGATASIGATVVFNRRFYRYLRHIRGRRFALRAVPWHLLYYASAGVGATLGTIRFVREKPSSGAAPFPRAGLRPPRLDSHTPIAPPSPARSDSTPSHLMPEVNHA
jgi:GT2 family glycosyltransferase